jgi:NAD-dependent dihydropyrimidine dehydrogenase PreA subunit
MTYVIGESCVDILDRSCVQECPVDCIYEGARMMYIHPNECVDCGACEPACPVEAIYFADDLPDDWHVYASESARFFAEALPGRQAPLGSPGAAAREGAIGVDTPYVAGLPSRGEQAVTTA